MPPWSMPSMSAVARSLLLARRIRTLRLLPVAAFMVSTRRSLDASISSRLHVTVIPLPVPAESTMSTMRARSSSARSATVAPAKGAGLDRMSMVFGGPSLTLISNLERGAVPAAG